MLQPDTKVAKIVAEHNFNLLLKPQLVNAAVLLQPPGTLFKAFLALLDGICGTSKGSWWLRGTLTLFPTPDPGARCLACRGQDVEDRQPARQQLRSSVSGRRAFVN